MLSRIVYIYEFNRYVRYLKKLCHLFLYIAFGRRKLDLILDLFDLRVQAIKFVG